VERILELAQDRARLLGSFDRLRDRSIGPQTPQLIAPESLATRRLVSKAPDAPRISR
jgi:hypothetical protein